MTAELTGTCRFYLARQVGPMAVELVDGGHGDHEGVAAAAKLHGAIFRDHGPWLMVEAHPLPDIDVPINEQAARDCAYLVAEFGPQPAPVDRGDDDGIA